MAENLKKLQKLKSPAPFQKIRLQLFFFEEL